MRELGSMLTPVRRVATFALKPLSGVFKMRKRKEPLPEEQTRHNREEISVLKKILKALGLQRAQAGGAGTGGLLGGLGGLADGLPLVGGKGLLKKAGKLLRRVRGVPIIGALAAGLSLYDWNEQSTEEKGGTVGSIAGGVAGGALGSILGPVGTVVGGAAGAWIGEKIGEAVAPKVEKWTSSLIAADLPGRMSAAWDTLVDGLSAWFKQKIEGIKEFAEDAATTAKDAAVNTGVKLAYNVDKAMAFLGNEDAKKRVANYEANQNKVKPVDPVKPKTNEVTLSKVLSDTKDAAMKQPESKPGAEVAPSSAPNLSKLIADHEAGKGNQYQAFNRGVAGDSINESIDFSKLTLQELIDRGKYPTGHKNRIFTAGKYQITTAGYDAKRKIRTEGTLGEAIANLGLSRDEKLTPELQERIFSEFLIHDKRPAVKAYLNGESNNLTAALYAMSQEMATFPVPKGLKKSDGTVSNGKSGYYDGDKAGNKASISIEEATKALNADRALFLSGKLKQPVIPEKAANTATLPSFAQNADIPYSLPSFMSKPVVFPTARPGPTPNLSPMKITRTEEVTSIKKVSGSDVARVIVVNSNDNISQNISNRQLAHAVTGGLGMRDYEM